MHSNYYRLVYSLMKVKRHMNTNYTRQNIKNATGEKQNTRKK